MLEPYKVSTLIYAVIWGGKYYKFFKFQKILFEAQEYRKKYIFT